MKKIKFGLLFGIALVLLSGCKKEREPYDGWNYSCNIYIDSTATACDVDSCILNLPWLRNKIEQAVADTAVIPYIEDWNERWACKGTMLEIHQYRDDMNDAYYFAFIYHRTDTIVYDCAGIVTKQHYAPYTTDERTVADINIGWYWWASI